MTYMVRLHWHRRMRKSDASEIRTRQSLYINSTRVLLVCVKEIITHIGWITPTVVEASPRSVIVEQGSGEKSAFASNSRVERETAIDSH